jgi:hypothetical protein
MNDIEEIRLKKFRSVGSFSLLFLTFFGGRFYLTNEFCHFIQIRQEKVKIRRSYLDEFDYQIKWVKYYKWQTIKIE